jgi:glycerol-3-phosphate dehydrogenase subunit C
MNNTATDLSNLQQCLKCNICAEVCPMMEANPLYPGPKQAGPDGERYRMKDPSYFDRAIKSCLNCKRCEVACPSGVKVGDIIARAKIRYSHSDHPLRDRMLSSTDFVGGIATAVAPVANAALSLGIAKSIMDATVGVSSKAVMPKYAHGKFSSWFRKSAPDQTHFGRYVDYFHGCYVNYNYPQLGRDFLTLINACGYGVHLLSGQKCCGVAQIANGFADAALKSAKTNLHSIRQSRNAVLTTSSSCTLTLKEEYSNILGEDTSDIQGKVEMAVKWLFDRVDSGQVKLFFRDDFHMKAAYHMPCHMQKLGCQFYSIELLKMVPGLELDVLEQKCCGMSGTFGFKKENYDLSQKIAGPLYDLIRGSGAEAVITDCETCKWQIEAGTGLPVFNPVSILARALDIEKTQTWNIKFIK